MRRESDTGFRAKIDKNVAGEEFTAYLLGIGHLDGDSAAALLGIAGSIYFPSVLVSKFDQMSGLAFGFLPNSVDTNFANDLDAGTGGFDGGNVRRAVH